MNSIFYASETLNENVKDIAEVVEIIISGLSNKHRNRSGKSCWGSKVELFWWLRTR